MLQLIEDWLLTKVGINLNLRELSQNNYFCDGCILFNILQIYGLLDERFGVNILPSTDREQCKKNLRLFTPLFSMLQVNYDDNVIQDIVMNKQSATLKMLYELYVCLENKQHLYFITRQNYDKVHANLIGTPELHNVTVSTKKSKEFSEHNLCFEQSIIQNRDIIEWYKQKYEQVQKCLNKRLRKQKVPPSPEKQERRRTRFRHSCSCSNFDLIDRDPLPDIETFPKSNDDKGLLDYDQFISSIKDKTQQAAAKKCFESKIQNYLLERTWSKVIQRQNEIYNSVFSEILLKQSQYEKQILTKLVQAQQQIKLQNENQVESCKRLSNEQERQMHADFELKEEFNDLEMAFEDERKRVLELHNKLYKAKQDKIKKTNFNLCYNIVDELIDIAVTALEYKSIYGISVPKYLWNNWMQLFFKSKPVHIPLQGLENDVLRGETDYDGVIEFEKMLDEILDENDVNEYIFTCGSWFIEDICTQYEENNESLLAFLVYRLLYTKYPLPQGPLPADLPTYNVAGILLGFENLEGIEKLKVLLSKACVHVFDTEAAIKTSIATFQKETAKPVEEKNKTTRKQSKNKDKNKSIKESIKTQKSKKGYKLKNKSETKEYIEGHIEGEFIKLADKETQTSIIKEECEKKVERTALGLIGEQVFNTLQNGEKVNDELLVLVLVEYLKSLDDINGWLLLNYPLTLEQASAIELGLTGKYLPVADYDQDENKSVENLEIDEFVDKRKSKLLYCPQELFDNQRFKTFFTVFIKAKEGIKPFDFQSKDDKTKLYEGDKVSLTSSNENEPNEVVSDVLETFYKDQCIFKEFSFDTLDLPTLKRIARIILNEDMPGGLGSIDLFGQESLNKLTKDKKKDKTKKASLDVKFKFADKKKKKSKRGNSSAATDDFMNQESIQLERIRTSVPFEDVEPEQPLIIEQSEVCPGDEDWKNVSLPINNELAIMLATIWENIESLYLNNLKDIFFESRIVHVRLVPYSSYIKNKVESVMNKPDMMQNVLNLFHVYYNSIANEMRAFTGIKNHLHCKVFDLQQNLWKMADDRKKEVEEKRRTVILENWLVNELCLLINNYLSLVQTEFVRSVETIKLINDYYLSMLDRTLPPATVSVPQTFFCKITKNKLLGIDDEAVSYNSEAGELQTSSSESMDEESVSNNTNFIAKRLIKCYANNSDYSTLNGHLHSEIEQAIDRLMTTLQGFQAQIKTESNLLASKTTKSSKTEKSSSKGGKPKKSPTKEPFNQEVKAEPADSRDLLLKEWSFVLNTEYDRFVFRMNLIKRRADEDVMEFYLFVESAFCELYYSNLARYNNVIANIGYLCEYLKTAIEEETPLTQPLVIEKDEFYINLSAYNRHKEKSVVKDLTENMINYYQFTIYQLNKLRMVFNIAAEQGIIRKQPLVYILSDLMLYNADNNQPHLPKVWCELSESQLKSIFDGMFGLEEAIDWREFIVYCLEIKFPEVEDILNLRRLFLLYDSEETEVISKDDYDNITLWFEKDLPDSPQEGLRIALVKNLLFDLFKVDEDKVNYTALLLYFCKDFDPKLGFKKALSLSLGKNVIISEDELNEILREESEVKEDVANLLLDIVNSIVHNRESVMIYEISESVMGSLSQIGDSWTGNETILSESIDEEQEADRHQGNSDHEGDETVDLLHVADVESLTDKWWISKIPVNSVISVLNAAFLNQDYTFSLRTSYLTCLDDAADNKDMIDAHVLIELSCIQRIFDMTKKFTVTIPSEVVKEVFNLQ